MTAETDELKGWIAMKLIARISLYTAIGFALGPLVGHMLLSVVAR